MTRAAAMVAALAATSGCASLESSEPIAARADRPGHGAAGRVVSSQATTLCGGRLPSGQPVDVAIRDGRIASVRPTDLAASCPANSVDLRGRWLAPAFIDSHVHLDYLRVADELPRGGIAGAVDLAAPLDSLDDESPLFMRRSGPMLTASKGYPTQSWGSDGYGLECDSPAGARRAVDRLRRAGAAVVKVAVGRRGLAPSVLASVVEHSHAHGLSVVAHALGRDDVLAASRAGVDALAHTPLQRLDRAALSAWRGKAVISTLTAFGSSDAAVSNLSALREHGAMILYGTDLGNSRHPGIDPDEIRSLLTAGLSGADILAAGTALPAAYWGFDQLGAISAGKSASILVLDSNPSRDPMTLSRPLSVYIDGQRRL